MINRTTCDLAHQRGAVLVVALIMLLATTLIVLSVFEMGGSNLLLVHNLESRQQSKNAAEATLEVAVSNLRDLIDSLAPGSPMSPIGPCGGRKNHRCVDLNGDGRDDIEVDLATPPPSCVGLLPQPNDGFDVADPDVQGCFLGTQQVGAVDGADSSGMSLCSRSLWDLRARAVDLESGAEARVRQGIGILVSSNAADSACP